LLRSFRGKEGETEEGNMREPQGGEREDRFGSIPEKEERGYQGKNDWRRREEGGGLMPYIGGREEERNTKGERPRDRASWQERRGGGKRTWPAFLEKKGRGGGWRGSSLLGGEEGWLPPHFRKGGRRGGGKTGLHL